MPIEDKPSIDDPANNIQKMEPSTVCVHPRRKFLTDLTQRRLGSIAKESNTREEEMLPSLEMVRVHHDISSLSLIEEFKKNFFAWQVSEVTTMSQLRKKYDAAAVRI